MKIQFELKPIQIVVGLGFIAFFILSVFQYLNNDGLKDKIKDSKIKVERLKLNNKTLNNNIVLINKEKDSIIAKADSLIIKEKYYRNKYFKTNAKLQKIIVDYNSASINDKNKLFTNAINN